MGKVESAHGGRRPHRKALRQGDACLLFCGQEIEKQPLLCVVGTCRIPRRGTDAAILFTDQILTRQRLSFAIPPRLARLLMEIFGKGLGQAVGQGFGHNRIVVIMVALELLTQEIHPDSRRHGKGTNMISTA